MRVALMYLLASTGCGFSLTSATPDGGGGERADVTPDACTTFSGQVDTCTVPRGMRLDLDGAYVFDTATGVLTREGGGAPAITFAVRLVSPDPQVVLSSPPAS